MLEEDLMVGRERLDLLELSLRKQVTQSHQLDSYPRCRVSDLSKSILQSGALLIVKEFVLPWYLEMILIAEQGMVHLLILECEA